jgi:molybdopterin-guanine dinucleotide biosynthesis protein A
MGRDKALLPFCGATLLQTLIDRYRVLGPVAVSVNAAGRFPFTGAAELVDRWPGQGPLTGSSPPLPGRTRRRSSSPRPTCPSGDVALARRLAALRGAADACLLARGEKGFEPAFAVYGRRCGEAAAQCLAAGRKSFFELLERVQVRRVLPSELPEFDLARILTNVNTPEDYAVLCEGE